MDIILNSLLLLFLFLALGYVADFAVTHIKYIGSVLGIKLFAFGILLGFVTTLPEFSLGINATLENVATISVGYLFGGIIVTLGLILGLSLVLNKHIHTDSHLNSLLPTIVVLFTPIMFGIDGKYGLWDGIAMISLYIALVLYLYKINHSSHPIGIEIYNKNKVAKSVLFSLIGIIGILVISHFTVQIAIVVFEHFNISQLLMGLLVFSIGTNLPEISIAITSWRKQVSELSLSHLLSSSFTNVLVLGILAFMQPIEFEVGTTYWVMSLFLAIILIAFTYFYHSNKDMDHKEGMVLVGIYGLFLVTNLFFLGTIF